MTLKQCILTRNDCYKAGTMMTGGRPTGIVVHSTGANNKSIKRYVQPLPTDGDYSAVIADIGMNIYGNHWNRSADEIGRSVCVHAFIGLNAAGSIETYQTLPFDMCCWGIGSGSKGSYNYNPNARVQFEICEDDMTNAAYFNAAFKEAVEFCAHLCKLYGLATAQICSHSEAYKAGYGSNHGDCDHWLKKFGKNMDWFRMEVDKLISDTVASDVPAEQPIGFKVGDIVNFKGIIHYASSNALNGVICKPGKAKITQVYNGRHPYHLVGVIGGSDVYGWVNATDISAVGAASTEPSPSAEPGAVSVGSIVKVRQGAKSYSGQSIASFVFAKTYRVDELKGTRAVLDVKGLCTAFETADLILV